MLSGTWRSLWPNVASKVPLRGLLRQRSFRPRCSCCRGVRVRHSIARSSVGTFLEMSPVAMVCAILRKASSGEDEAKLENDEV